jgi:hypothetical protein
MTNRLRSVPRHRFSLTLLAAVASVCGAAFAHPSTSFGAVTIGTSNLSSPVAFNDGCNPCTEMHFSSTTSQIAAPIDGVATRYRIRRTDAWGDVRLRILRPVGGGVFDGVGTGPPVTVGPGPDAVLEFPAQLPIRAGDHVGVNSTALTQLASMPGSQIGFFSPPLDDEDPPAAPSVFGGDLLLQVDIEPDCDSDGFGDETQDPELTGPECPPTSKTDRTLTLDSNKGKVEKGRKVRLTGQIDAPLNEPGCEPNQTVELQRKKTKAPETAFSTFRTLQTDLAGNFADKVKVKKTRIYRAVVRENASCDEELSNTQKVRVQKKKAAQEA